MAHITYARSPFYDTRGERATLARQKHQGNGATKVREIIERTKAKGGKRRYERPLCLSCRSRCSPLLGLLFPPLNVMI